MTNNKAILIEEHSIKELFVKLDAHDKKLDAIHNQTKLTNGRVTALEKQSVGRKLANNPFKFAVGFTVLILFLISDTRQPIISALINLII